MSCPPNLTTVHKDTKIDDLPPVFYVDNSLGAVGDNDVKCEGPFMLTYTRTPFHRPCMEREEYQYSLSLLHLY